jgi:Alpha amylase, catalytic domain/Domain of unknown function (DUF3459)
MTGLVSEHLNTPGRNSGPRADRHAGEGSQPPRPCAAPQLCKALASPETLGGLFRQDALVTVDTALARRVSALRRSGLARVDPLRLLGRWRSDCCRSRRVFVTSSLFIEDFLAEVEITKQTKATSYWDNALYENCFHALWWNQIDSKIMDVFNNNRWLDSSDKVATIYLGNHDHSHVNWQAGARENAGALCWYKTQLYVIALLTCPGTPMIQNGQEFGEDHWILENDENTGRRVLPRPLHWKFFNDRIGYTLFGLYRWLIAFRKNSPALRSPNFYPRSWEPWQTRFNPEGYGVDTEKQVAIYHRWGQDANGGFQRVIIVLNFSAMDQDVTVPFSDNGTWEDLLSGWKLEAQNYRHSFTVGSNWGHVFVQ